MQLVCDIQNEYVSWRYGGIECNKKKQKPLEMRFNLTESINSVTPVLTDNPETNYSANGSFTKKYHFSLRLNTRLSWFNYSQTLNSDDN
jgi:hypothetical protein